MAKREAAGAVKKPYSSKLLQMRFMQRGTQPAATAEVGLLVSLARSCLLQSAIVKAALAQQEPSPTEKEATATETEWTSNWGPQAGCSVIVEADPLPGASRGRLSFHSFNPAAEKLQVRIPNL